MTTDHTIDRRTPEPPCPDCGTDLYVQADRGPYGWQCGYCGTRFD